MPGDQNGKNKVTRSLIKDGRRKDASENIPAHTKWKKTKKNVTEQYRGASEDQWAETSGEGEKGV